MFNREREIELEHCYQPIVDISSNKISHHEVLLRAKRKAKSIDIGSYISELEKSGSIFDLDSWNLITLSEKLGSGRVATDSPFAINISAKTAQDARILPIISDVYRKLGNLSSLLHIEITESARIDDPDSVKEFVEIVKSNGGVVSIDDYGAGFTRPEYLSNFEPDVVKIDGKYIDNIISCERSRRFVEKVVEMTGMMGMSVVAERVEDSEQLAVLKDLGVQFAQGYFYAKPMPNPVTQKAIDYIAERNTNHDSSYSIN